MIPVAQLKIFIRKADPSAHFPRRTRHVPFVGFMSGFSLEYVVSAPAGFTDFLQNTFGNQVVEFTKNRSIRHSG
jgi:hypothetical protein